MLRNLFITLTWCFFTTCLAQDKNSKLQPDAIEVYYGIGNENTFLFNDTDYLYKTQYLKVSFQYVLSDKKNRLSLGIQPQIHFLKHQLLNPFFVRESEINFEQDRISFNKLKQMHLYGLEVELNIRRTIFSKFDVSAFLAIGPALIDTRTERLAKGFTFIETIGFGIDYRLSNRICLSVRPAFSHISNARIQLPNSGYNVLNLETGISWKL